MPKRAFPAKPGMPLFGALHQKTEAFQNFAAPRCVTRRVPKKISVLGFCFLGFRFRRLKKGPRWPSFFWGVIRGLLGGNKGGQIFFFFVGLYGWICSGCGLNLNPGN